MGVDVDEPGRQRQPVEVDHLGTGVRRELARCTDAGDAVAGDGHVGGSGRGAGSVDQRGAAQQEVHRSDGPQPAPLLAVNNGPAAISCHAAALSRTAARASSIRLSGLVAKIVVNFSTECRISSTSTPSGPAVYE